MVSKLFNWSFLIYIVLTLVSCSDNDKKIIGEWQRTVVESDGGKYLETYIFYDEDNDNIVEYSYIPQDYSHIGYTASGRWDLDLIGNLELYLNPTTAKAIYNFYPDKWQKTQINSYISEIKSALSQQMKEMEEASIGLEIIDDLMILETLSGKDRFHRISIE